MGKIDGKRQQEKDFFLNFFGQKFLTWTFPKSFLWWRNGQKRHGKNLKIKKKKRYHGT
jgi:hypothetical protein